MRWFSFVFTVRFWVLAWLAILFVGLTPLPPVIELMIIAGVDAHLGWVVADADTGAYGILDLMAIGIPAVASESGIADRYIANGITGALYPPDDSASTAATVAGLLLSDEARQAMGRAARTRVARAFPETNMIEGFDRAANSARTRSRRG